MELYGPEEGAVLITGFDASDNEIKLLEEGRLAGVMAQNPYAMGYASAVSAFREIAGLENASLIDTGHTWITPENLFDPAVQLLIYK